MKPSDAFVVAVRKRWGDPKAVAEAGLEELLRCAEDVLGFSYTDEFSAAIIVGVLAGETAKETPDAFIAAFTKKFFAKGQ